MRRIKKILVGILVCSIILGGVGYTFAEEGKPKASTTNSTAYIEFKSHEGTNKPGNPLDPSQKIDPITDEYGHDATEGELTIDYVSNFNFGQHEIGDIKTVENGNEVFYANLDKVKKEGKEGIIAVPNFVSVTDKRGTNDGWELKVEQNGQFKSGQNELEGAQLELLNITEKSSISNEYAPEPSTRITLNPEGEAVKVANAEKGKGMGNWLTVFGENEVEGKKSIKLTVPVTSRKTEHKYTTILTWTLEDTPQGDIK